MTYIAKVNMGSGDMPIASALYGTCSTAGNTAAKEVTCADFDQLMTGVTITVKFTNTNFSANPTLNVNSTGAKTIKLNNQQNAGSGGSHSWIAGGVATFTYDGTNWIMNDWQPPTVPTADEITTSNDDTVQDELDELYGRDASDIPYMGVTQPFSVEDALDELYDAVGASTPSTTTPKVDGTAAVGTEDKYARGDHVHPLSYSETHTTSSTRRTQVTKYADGTMICGIWAKVTATVNTRWTYAYYGEVSLGSWPEAFAAEPIVTAAITARTGTSDAWVSLTGVTASSCGSAFIYRPASTNSANYEVNLIAFGRWK